MQCVLGRVGSGTLTLLCLVLPTASFLVGDNKTQEEHKDMLKLLSIRADAFTPTELAPTEAAGPPEVEAVQTSSKSMRMAYKVLPVTVACLVLLCCV